MAVTNNKPPQPEEFIDDDYREKYARPNVHKATPIDIPEKIVKNCQYCSREVTVKPAGERTICPACTHPINYGEIK